MRAFIWLQLCSFLIVEDALFEVLHDKSHPSNKLVEYGTSVYILGCCAQNIISFLEVSDVTEDIGKLFQGSNNVWDRFLLHALYGLICLIDIAVTLSELIKNRLDRGSASVSIGWFCFRLSGLFCCSSFLCRRTLPRL